MYAPRVPPSDPKDLQRWLADEFRAVLAGMTSTVDRVRHEVLYAAPDKPRAGEEFYADGTSWNPGGTGEGLYRYTVGGSYVKVG